MGQAAVDLPDPLSAGSVSSANTDDLLAQLAGDEIERLLAEADSAPVNADGATQSTLPDSGVRGVNGTSAPAPKPTPQPVSNNDVSLLVEASSGAAAPATARAAGSKSEADLDALFSHLEGGAPAGKANEEKLKVEPANVENEPSAADALAAEMLEDAATHSGGRSALGPSSAAHGPTKQSAGEKAESTSIFLRILSLASAPLDHYPDRVRDLIGWIAIVTTVNSAAILAYVWVFRHR